MFPATERECGGYNIPAFANNGPFVPRARRRSAASGPFWGNGEMRNNRNRTKEGQFPSSPRLRTYDARPPNHLIPPPHPPTTQLMPAHIFSIPPPHKSNQRTKRPPEIERQQTKRRRAEPDDARDIHTPALTLPQCLVNKLLPLHRPLPLEKGRRHAYRYVAPVWIVVRASHINVVCIKRHGYLCPAGVNYVLGGNDGVIYVASSTEKQGEDLPPWAGDFPPDFWKREEIN